MKEDPTAGARLTSTLPSRVRRCGRLHRSVERKLDGRQAIPLHRPIIETRFDRQESPRALERQRKIHDSLITMGLKLISDSYLDGMSRLCRESNLEFEPRMMDGKHHIEILKDLAGSQHDLVVIGALGVGRARDSVIANRTVTSLQRAIGEVVAMNMVEDVLVRHFCDVFGRQVTNELQAPA